MRVSQSVIEIIANKCVEKVFLATVLRNEKDDPQKVLDECALELSELIRDELEEEGVPLQRQRTAAVLGDEPAEKIASYLPANFRAFQRKGHVEIVGYDKAGWTLDGYVIPRLASGLIVATEVK